MTKIVTEGPAGYMPQSAPSMGVDLAPEGQALLYGNVVSEEEAMRDAARALLTKKNPTIFPGPQVLWDWKEDVAAIVNHSSRRPNNNDAGSYEDMSDDGHGLLIMNNNRRQNRANCLLHFLCGWRFRRLWG